MPASRHRELWVNPRRMQELQSWLPTHLAISPAARVEGVRAVPMKSRLPGDAVVNTLSANGASRLMCRALSPRTPNRVHFSPRGRRQLATFSTRFVHHADAKPGHPYTGLESARCPLTPDPPWPAMPTRALDPHRHAAELFDAYAQDPSGQGWTYPPYGPFADAADYAS